MESQQHGCLSKASIMTRPVEMPTWAGDILHGPAPGRAADSQWFLMEEESVFSRDRFSYWLSSLQWSALELGTNAKNWANNAKQMQKTMPTTMPTMLNDCIRMHCGRRGLGVLLEFYDINIYTKPVQRCYKIHHIGQKCRTFPGLWNSSLWLPQSPSCREDTVPICAHRFPVQKSISEICVRS